MNEYEKSCKEWLKGCSCANANKQEECEECTKVFLDHIKKINDSPVKVEAGVKLPSQQNAILIMFKDNLDNPRIDMTPYLWDILKAMEDQEFLFTKELDGWKCEINISMARSV